MSGLLKESGTGHDEEMTVPKENGGERGTKEGEKEEERTAECGLWGFKPAFLQPCANPFSFVMAYSLTTLMTSTLSSYINSQVTTLERQFGFNSSQTGLIMAANDIGYLTCVVVFSYLAIRLHIPRTVAILTLGFGVSGVFCSMPHFLFGVGNDATNDVNVTVMTSQPSQPETFGQLCMAEAGNRNTNSCATKETEIVTSASRGREYSQAALVLIVIGMILQGICKSPRWSYVIFYVDNNIKDKTKSGFYLGIVVALAIFGPILAFVLGGLFTRIYVTLQPTELTPTHPQWIGAWWLGFLVFGAGSFFSALPLFCYPRWMRGQQSLSPPSSSSSAAAPSEKKSRIKKILDEAKNFSAAMRRLLTNPVLLCLVVSMFVELFAVGGMQAFTPKYVENQFSLPAWKTNLNLAVSTMAASSLGTFVGGWLTRRLKMTPIFGLKFTIVLQLLGAVAASSGFFLKCSQPSILNRPDKGLVGASCIEGCDCEGAEYLPVCGSDYHTYYSPCHAGCLTAVDQSTFSNCSCIPDGAATAGVCDYSCYSFYIYVALQAFSAFCSTCAIMPKFMAFIRCVEPRDKALAVGCNSFMTSLLGWLLGPVVFGKMIDTVCDVWETTCYGRGTCLLYDNDLFRVRFYAYITVSRVGAALFIFLGFLVARVTKRLDGPADDKKGAEPVKPDSSDK